LFSTGSQDAGGTSVEDLELLSSVSVAEAETKIYFVIHLYHVEY